MASADLRRAFGLDFACDPALESLPVRRAPAVDGAAPTRVSAVAAEAIDAAWRSQGGGVRVVREGTPGSAEEQSVLRAPTGAHRLTAGGYGEAIISPDGLTVTGAAAETAPGRFERFLVARALPWTALVRGIEVLHAAAVVVDGRAVALVGQSGAGKTSLAVRLVLAGAGFLTDDVLAVDRDRAGVLRAHPGPRAAGLRAGERDLLGAPDRAALGPLRPLDGKAFARLAPAPGPVPLGAVLLITRPQNGEPSSASSSPVVQRLDPPPAELLLASTFVLSVRTPARLANLLEICADVAATVPLYQVRVRHGEDAARTAAAIEAVL